MLNIIGRKLPFILGFSPFNWADIVDKTSETSQAYFLERDPNETGWDRLYNMYSVDEWGGTSPEMTFVIQGTLTGLCTGVMWGGMMRARQASADFVERNQASRFESHFEAKKKLQETVMINFGKGAFRWGWRLGLFTGSFILLTTSISTYRGKSSLIEYATAGGLTGLLYKFSLGPRGMLVGGGLGTVLGSIGGLLSLGLLKLSGTTMEEIRYWQYNWKKSRDRLVQQALATASEPDPPMLKEHDAKVQKMLDNEKNSKT